MPAYHYRLQPTPQYHCLDLDDNATLRETRDDRLPEVRGS